MTDSKTPGQIAYDTLMQDYFFPAGHPAGRYPYSELPEAGREAWEQVATAVRGDLDAKVEELQSIIRMLSELHPVAQVDYTNHAGERSIRHISPIGWGYGTNNWHKEPGFLITCWDHDRQAVRVYSLSGIHFWNGVEISQPRPDHAGGVSLRTVLDELSKRATPGLWVTGDDGEGLCVLRHGNLEEHADALPWDAPFIVALVNAYRDGELAPTQAPDKAAEREGLKARMVAALDGKTAYSRDCHLSGEYLCSLVWPMVEEALAPNPTGTEAGRGVGAGIWCEKPADDVLAEMIEVATAEEGSEIAEEWPLDCRTKIDQWQASLQPALGHFDGFPSKGAAAKDLAQRIAKRLHECGGCQVSPGAEYGHITSDGIRLIAETLLAATPTPPASAALGEAEYLRERRDHWVNEAQRLALLVRSLGGNPEPPAGDVPGEAQTTPDSTAQGDGTSREDADRKERARRRIQALGAALSRRDWSETERAYEAIRDAHDRPKVYDAPTAPADREGGR